MKKIVLIAGLLLVTADSGCSRMIDEGFEKALGPTPKIMFLDPKPPEDKNNDFLSPYRNFVLGKVDASQFPETPRDFIDYLPTKFVEQTTGRHLPADPAGKTLVVNVAVLAYQPALKFQKATGPTEEVVAKVELVDKDSGKVVGRAICIGRTYQSVGLGTKWKAWGLCRAIVNEWIDEYYPDKDDREKTAKEEPPK
ncbi:MAG: hypothetical protein HZA50_17565 [Planctomycetes bacterium]|nr:hypothetical protein [Planctomycetota bacterium]